MTTYFQSARTLLREFVLKQHISKGQMISRQEILTYFSANFPKLKTSTINAHIIMMTTNAPSRTYYNLRADGEDDLFFQVDRSRLRLYEPERDPAPIYPDEISA